jgi:class 3 adenylate cyclase
MSLLMGALSLLAGQTLMPLEWLEAKLFDIRVYFQQDQAVSERLILAEVSAQEYPSLLELLRAPALDGLKTAGLDLPKLFNQESENLIQTAKSVNYPLVLASHRAYQKGQPIGIYTYLTSLKPYFFTGVADYLAESDGIIRKQEDQFQYRSSSDKKKKSKPTFAWVVYRQDNPQAKSAYNSFLHPSASANYTILSLPELRKMNADAFKNKILLVGSIDTPGNLKTPLQSRLKPIEVHAQTLNGWINDNYYRHPPLLNLLLPLLLAGLTFATLYLTLRWGLLVSLLAILLLLASYCTLSILAFQYFYAWLDLTSPLLSVMLTAGSVTVFFNRTEGQRRAAILSTFRRHLPDEMVKELLERSEPESLTLHERRVVTVMFTDIKGFSRMGEKLPPDQIIRILNEYLTAMTDIVFNNQGTLDKYIGDGIMAVYGNIGENNPRQNAYYAVKTALEMRIEMEKLQKKWMHQGLRPLQIRIGINTGEALVGYVGHPKRKEVTVIGDTVNTASRIETLNKKYHSHILISHSTYEYVKDWMDYVPLGEEKLTGKSSSVKIYEIRGWKEESLQV